MTKSIDRLALDAASNERAREQLIRSQEQLILRTASATCHRYVSKSDDEWSVALCAFSKAIDLYDSGKGAFLPFAQMLIKRDLVDAHRSQRHVQNELATAPHVLEGGGEPEEDVDGAFHAVLRESRASSDREEGSRDIAQEINAVNGLLGSYGFRFFDLTECSPKQGRTQRECATAIRFMLEQPELLEQLEDTKQLPIKAVAAGSGVSRKTLDRHRRYIIMAVLVLGGDFPHLAEYLRFVKEGEDG